MKILFLMLTCSALGAAPGGAGRLTLEEALAMAERGRPEFAEIQAVADAAQARSRDAGRLPNPELIAGAEAAPLSGRTAGEAEYLAGFAQAIPLGGRLGRERAAAVLESETRAREAELRRRELRQQVHAAFATALYQQEAAGLQSASAEALGRTAEIARARVGAGDAPADELRRAEMEHARARLEAGRAEALRGQALAKLAAAVGNPSMRIEAVEGELRQAFDVPSLESLSASLEGHPLLALAAADVRLGEARADLARAQRIPDLKVEVLYRRMEGERRNAGDLAVSIPIPLFDRRTGHARAARAEAGAAVARREAAEHELQARARQAHARLGAALAELRLAEEEILPRADRIAKAAEARHELGDAALGEVLAARRDWSAARLAWLESLRDAMSAWLELRTVLPEAEISR